MKHGELILSSSSASVGGQAALAAASSNRLFFINLNTAQEICEAMYFKENLTLVKSFPDLMPGVIFLAASQGSTYYLQACMGPQQLVRAEEAHGGVITDIYAMKLGE